MNPPGDPELTHLRSLLRQQLACAERGDWQALPGLCREVERALTTAAGLRATGPALAEVAHLDLRLQQTLHKATEEMGERARGLAARRAYQRHAGFPPDRLRAAEGQDG